MIRANSDVEEDMRHEAGEQGMCRPQDALSHTEHCEHFPEALGKP